MADPNNVSQYKYSAMSNLVLQADRRFVTRRNDEVTGDPESLAGRINIRDMGSRTGREDAPRQKKKAGLQEVERGSIREGEDVLEREQRKRKRGEPAQMRGAGILSAGDALIEGIKYRPRTPATRATYDLILTLTANALGDVSHEVVRSATDAVLETLKDDSMKDLDKKKEIDDLVGISMSSKEFNDLVNLGKKLTDYEAQDEDDNMDDGGGADNGAELDERQGVAVVFDESDDENEGGEQTFEVRDEGEPSSDEEDAQAAPDVSGAIEETAVADDVDSNASDGGMVLDGGLNKSVRPDRNNSQDVLQTHEVDAYWLQRQIGMIYTDAHVQQTKTQEALQTLSGIGVDGEEMPLRDIENDLMELFDYEQAELVGQLVSNRSKVVWVTRWRRAAEDDDARHLVENQMIEAGQSGILDELRGKNFTREDDGTHGAKRMKMDLMDIDIPKPTANGDRKQEQKDGELVGGLQPKNSSTWKTWSSTKAITS